MKPVVKVKIQSINPAQAEALALQLCGFRKVVVEGQDYLVPLDETHPEFSSSTLRVERARKKAAS